MDYGARVNAWDAASTTGRTVIFTHRKPRKNAAAAKKAPRNYRVWRLQPPRVMPGLEPGIQASPSVIIRGRRPWMHGLSPCMAKTESAALISGRRRKAAASPPVLPQFRPKCP
jgi:hypothetical protein